MNFLPNFLEYHGFWVLKEGPTGMWQGPGRMFKRPRRCYRPVMFLVTMGWYRDPGQCQLGCYRGVYRGATATTGNNQKPSETVSNYQAIFLKFLRLFSAYLNHFNFYKRARNQGDQDAPRLLVIVVYYSGTAARRKKETSLGRKIWAKFTQRTLYLWLNQDKILLYYMRLNEVKHN